MRIHITHTVYTIQYATPNSHVIQHMHFEQHANGPNENTIRNSTRGDATPHVKKVVIANDNTHVSKHER